MVSVSKFLAMFLTIPSPARQKLQEKQSDSQYPGGLSPRLPTETSPFSRIIYAAMKVSEEAISSNQINGSSLRLFYLINQSLSVRAEYERTLARLSLL